MARNVLLVAALALLTGCRGSGQPARMIQQVEGAEFTERQARVQLYEFVRHWASVVERAADRIADSTTDTRLRRNAIRWKMEALPACQTAAFRDDPVAALFDVWALAIQMRDYLATGVGSDLFGEHQAIAIAAAEELVADLETTVAKLHDPERGRALVREWATENPIRQTLLNRATTAPILLQYTGEPKHSALGALRNVDQRIVDLLERLDLYVERLPGLLRWHAEYVVEQQVLSLEEKRTLLGQVASMRESLARLAGLLDEVADLTASEREEIAELVRSEREAFEVIVNEQREKVLDAVTAEREAAFADIDRQREAAFEAVGKERERAFREIDGQREAVVCALREEREAVLAAIDAQREATLEEIRILTRDAIARATDSGEEVIDHFFARAALFGGGGIVVLFLAGLAFVRLARRNR